MKRRDDREANSFSECMKVHVDTGRFDMKFQLRTALNEKIMKLVPKDEDIPESKKQFYKDWKNKIDGFTKSFYNDAQEHIRYDIDSKPAAVHILPPGNHNEDSVHSIDR